jgi:hypothetical protein
MLSANYTSENICRALGLGGFANDWQLAQSDECIRVLLKPSFHREICISVLSKEEKVSVVVIAALSQIWLQDWPIPQLTKVEQEAGILSEVQFARFSSLLNSAAEPKQQARFVVLDGMPAHTVLRADRKGKLNIDKNVGVDASYESFIAEVITQAHGAIGSPSIRNALADAGSYAGLRIPSEVIPPAKDAVRTLVLGEPEQTALLLEALSQQHKA